MSKGNKYIEIERYSKFIDDLNKKNYKLLGRLVIRFEDIVSLEVPKQIKMCVDYYDNGEMIINNVDEYAILNVVNRKKVKNNEPDFIEYIIDKQDYQRILFELYD